LYRPINRFVAGAAAQVAGERLLNRRNARTPRDVERRHDHAWRADAALRTAFRRERILQRMELAVLAQAFDRQHVSAVEMRGGNQARVDGDPIDQHRARAAFPFAATFLGTGQVQILAQDIERALHRVHVQPPGRAVHLAGDHRNLAALISFSGVAGMARISKPA
jgi:hypothetical protein